MNRRGTRDMQERRMAVATIGYWWCRPSLPARRDWLGTAWYTLRSVI